MIRLGAISLLDKRIAAKGHQWQDKSGLNDTNKDVMEIGSRQGPRESRNRSGNGGHSNLDKSSFDLLHTSTNLSHKTQWKE
jgi:hypothetical protein